MRRLTPVWVIAVMALAVGFARAQTAAPAAASGSGGERCLVMPFQNRSGDSSLDWMGESFVVGLRQALEPGGVEVLDHSERERARGLLGAPEGVELSQASLMGMAKSADVQWLVTGWFNVEDGQLTASADVIDMQREHLSRLTPAGVAMKDLQQLQAQLGRRIGQVVTPSTAAGGADPKDDGAAMPITAYEDYVRARMAPAAKDQVTLLRTAAQLAPKDGRVLLALGEAYYRAVMDAPAAAVLEQIPASDPRHAEAAFRAGLAEYGLGHFTQAIAEWEAVEQTLPLPEVVHNLAVARAAKAGEAHPGALEANFPAAAYRQLQQVVGKFEAGKTAAMTAEQQVAFDLQQGERLRRDGGLEAAAQAYERVLQAAGADAPAQAAAHAGLAAIWYARHDNARAAQEVKAALTADPNNAEAQQVRDKLQATPRS